MNPSVGQILEAITARQRRARDRAAEQPERPARAPRTPPAESTKDVRVVATGSVPEGIVAAFEFDAGADVDANEEAMRGRDRRRSPSARSRRASRDATVDGVAVAERRLPRACSTGVRSPPAPTSGPSSTPLLDRFAADGRSLVQVLRGEDAPEARRARRADRGARSSSPTCSGAASPTTRSCSRRSRARGGPPPARRGQRRLSLVARAPARAAAGARGGRRGRRAAPRPRTRRASSRPTSSSWTTGCRDSTARRRPAR